MAKLTDEQRAQLEELTALAEAPDETESSESRVHNINYTIDLDNEDQVKRAVRAGLLPKSYLEDDAPADGGGDDPPKDDAPKRVLDKRFS